jgi:hypothetical protein
MANRCDFNSVFPRQLKRIWTMTKFENAHDAGAWKRDFIAAHAIHKAYKNKKQRMEGAAVVESDVAETVG